MTLDNDLAEIKIVRDKMLDAGTLIAEPIVNEQTISSSVDTVFTMYTMVYEVNGVWLRDDTEHTGTNYYEPDGTYDKYTGMITLGTSLPDPNTEVLISYTYFKGLHDEVIDQFLKESKYFVESYTGKDYDWTQGYGSDPDPEVERALLAAASVAAKRCIQALSSGSILQMGANMRLGDFELESMVRGGGFHVQAMIDLLNEEINQKLAMLGRKMYYNAQSTKSYGRDYWGYKRRGSGNRRSGVY